MFNQSFTRLKILINLFSDHFFYLKSRVIIKLKMQLQISLPHLFNIGNLTSFALLTSILMFRGTWGNYHMLRSGRSMSKKDQDRKM